VEMESGGNKAVQWEGSLLKGALGRWDFQPPPNAFMPPQASLIREVQKFEKL